MMERLAAPKTKELPFCLNNPLIDIKNIKKYK